MISFLGTLLAVFLQEQNLVYLDGKFPSRGGMLTSADEASYFAPARNFIQTGIWKDNSPGLSAYFQRTPGYGFVYLVCLFFAGSKALLMLKFIQVLAFFGSVLLFGKILERFVSNDKLILVSAAVYAFLPCFSGFMYFTLTESLTPFLLLWSVYEWLAVKSDPLSRNGWRKTVFWLLISNAVMVLFRPQLMLFTLAFGCSFLFQKQLKAFGFTLLALLPLLLWNVRTVSISGKWLGIHPIYSETNNTLYRPSHEMLTNLFRIWEADGEIFHSTVAILAKDTSAVNLKSAELNVPEKYRTAIEPVLRDFQKLNYYRTKHFSESKPLKGPFRGERAFLAAAESKRQELIAQYPADNYVKTPLKSLKKLMISSHLNLGVWQFKYRGTWWMEVLRWTCVGVILCSFLAALASFARFKLNPDFWLSAAICITVCYLFYVQRMNEERYLTPMLPVALIVLVCNLRILFKFKRILKKSKKV